MHSAVTIITYKEECFVSNYLIQIRLYHKKVTELDLYLDQSLSNMYSAAIRAIYAMPMCNIFHFAVESKVTATHRWTWTGNILGEYDVCGSVPVFHYLPARSHPRHCIPN